jgi:hypothetical protein
MTGELSALKTQALVWALAERLRHLPDDPLRAYLVALVEADNILPMVLPEPPAPPEPRELPAVALLPGEPAEDAAVEPPATLPAPPPAETPLLPTPSLRLCKNPACRKPLVRRADEPASNFKIRKFCDRDCYNATLFKQQRPTKLEANPEPAEASAPALAAPPRAQETPSETARRYVLDCFRHKQKPAVAHVMALSGCDSREAARLIGQCQDEHRAAGGGSRRCATCGDPLPATATARPYCCQECAEAAEGIERKAA